MERRIGENMEEKSNRMYHDPEFDRVVTEDVIKEQYEYFKDSCSYLSFREQNFTEVEKIEDMNNSSIYCSDKNGIFYKIVNAKEELKS